MRNHNRNDRGQVAPLLAAVALAAGVACFGLGRFAASAVDAAQARTAADAAALAAAATGDEGVAREVASRNGGRLISFERAGGDVRVRVRVGDQAASARARRSATSSDALTHRSVPGRQEQWVDRLRSRRHG